ncbi:phosphotransferase [Candidatus Pelagibacter sp. HIMB1483]|uniref:phosphotransferase n=1 Tax=Candidatus Pelagibacter sp. HIMB1483 TaxID=3415414 RepID=UPI003F83D085
MKNLKKLKGDASFRQFYRKKNKNLSSIIVFAKKEKLKNLIIYDAINKILRKNKILAPNLYKENYKKNYIEIEDFGNETIFEILKRNKNDKFHYFKRIIKILNQIQLIKDTKIKNFKKRNYKIPKYNTNILVKEANLFCDWYIKKKLSKKKREIFTKKFKKIVKKLAFNLQLKNNVFVHRDFHVSNLMLVGDKIGLIDSQDALIGNKAYDLASLIDDVRLKTSNSFKKKIFNFYLSKQSNLNTYKFKNDFEILSILRNLKIIGIFMRLAHRDNKKNYLKLIPYAWKLIDLRIHENELFLDLKNLLSKNLKRKL